MQRNQILAVLVGLASAGGVALYALGSASAADWHTYTGDVYPGHAYAVQIPADARSLEARFAGNGSASLTLLDPSGAKVGHYDLDGKLPAAAVAQPKAGAYTLFVYGLTDGALTLAVDSASTPQAQLAELKLAREDVEVASFDQPAPLDKAMTATFHAAPLFVTVLYQGSVEALDATLASDKGDVMTIAGESGTAFSPGVAVAQQGARTNAFGNLDGTAYTLTAHAKSFQGTLFLTALSVAPPAAVATGGHPMRHAHNASHEEPAPSSTTTTAFPTDAPTALRLDAGHAFGFFAQPGKLVLADPRGDRGATVLIYRPDDVLLGAYTLGGSSRSVDLPVAGEYVAYVAHAPNDLVYADVPGGDGQGFDLPLARENFTASFGDFLGGDSQTIHLEHVPVALQMFVADDAAVAGGYELRNAKGMVAEWSALVDLGGSDPLSPEGAYVDPSNFAAGEHTLRADGIAQGSVRVLTTYFERTVAVAVPVPEPASPPEPSNETSSNETGNDTWNGTFPWDPTSGPFPPAPDAPRSLLMIPEIPALPRLS